MEELDVITFSGGSNLMTFTGPVEIPVAFTLVLAEDADRNVLESAVKSLGMFLFGEAAAKLEAENGFDGS